MNTSVLSIPNSGRLPIWTGNTISGGPNTMLHLQNRQVQLHFSTNDNVNELTCTVRDSLLQQLATFLFEYPTRHYGILCDELDPARFLLPGINDNVPIHGRQRADPVPIHHLRISEPEIIGRDVYHGCPNLFDQMGPLIQASEILYSHHHQRNVDILVIKLTLAHSSPSYMNDFILGFPSFEFNTPMMFRQRYKLNERNHIFRTRMALFQKVITVAQLPTNNPIRARLTEIDYYSFELELNDELSDQLPNQIHRAFTEDNLHRTAQNVLNQVFQLGLTYDQGTRASTAESQQIFDYLIEDNDPCLKILKDHLSLESLYDIHPLCSTKIIKFTSSARYVIRFQLSL